MFSESGRQLAPILPFPDIPDPSDKVPARFCPWLLRCRSEPFWKYPASTIRGIPVDDAEMLETLANLQPKSRQASEEKFQQILRFQSFSDFSFAVSSIKYVAFRASALHVKKPAPATIQDGAPQPKPGEMISAALKVRSHARGAPRSAHSYDSVLRRRRQGVTARCRGALLLRGSLADRQRPKSRHRIVQ